MKFPKLMSREFVIIACAVLLLFYSIFNLVAAWTDMNQYVLAGSNTVSAILVVVIVAVIMTKVSVLGGLQNCLR